MNKERENNGKKEGKSTKTKGERKHRGTGRERKKGCSEGEAED